MATVIKSLRIDPTLWAQVEAHAKALGVSPNAAAAELMQRGLGAPAAAPVRATVSERPTRWPDGTVRRRILGFHPVTGEPICEGQPVTPKQKAAPPS